MKMGLNDFSTNEVINNLMNKEYRKNIKILVMKK